MLKYRNYIAKLEVNTDTHVLHGKVLNISDPIVFEGKTVKEAEEKFYQAVDNYVKFCQEQGKEPAKPFSGKLPFRTTPEIHRDIYIAATKADKSINAWMEEVLSQAARQDEQSSSSTESNQEAEISLAQYEALLPQLYSKITQLQNAIQPYLDKKPGSFAPFFQSIKPFLKDNVFSDLLEKVDRFRERITRIQSENEAFLSQIEEIGVEQSKPVSQPIASLDDEKDMVIAEG